jgi:hypothetical protein
MRQHEGQVYILHRGEGPINQQKTPADKGLTRGKSKWHSMSARVKTSITPMNGLVNF